MDEQDMPELLTTIELAKLLRVSRGTVSGWARRGLVPYIVTPTGHRRFSRATVLELLRERGGTTELNPALDQSTLTNEDIDAGPV